MSLQIDPEFKSLIPALSHEEYSRLEKNLLKETSPESIILLTWNGILIDGHNRYEICTKHNIPFKAVEKNGFKDRDDAKVWIIDNQLGRRNIPALVKIDLHSKKQDILDLRERAKQRMVEASHPKRDDNVAFQNSEKQPEKEFKKVNIIKKIATETELSTDTVSRGLQILKKGPEELKQKALKGEASINEVYKEIKKRELLQRRQNTTPVPIPIGKFRTIEADPPWMLESNEGKSAINQYPLMDLDEIKKLRTEIDKIADDNCHLYLWAINPMLPDAFEVMKAWGFEYKTVLTWVKNNGFGTGHYFRGATEHILFGVRGKLDTLQKDQPTYFEANRTKHSEKPEGFYEIVERMSPAPYIRMFARSQRDSWISWGNEV